MRFRTPIQAIFLGLALGIFLWLGMGQNPILAAPLEALAQRTDSAIVSAQQDFSALESAVDQYLMAMPKGYYTISKVEELKSLMAQRQPLLVDVRSPSEYRLGHIPGATNIPLQQMARHLDQIPSDRPVVLYCSTGYRSAMGVMTLHLLNYDNVQGFPPSFAAWQAAGEAIAQ
ncbi:MAG: rhodanese-like domain-containing protein [Thermosynechococcaceae cyanobacterium MS004]|nr:rhodanese-like domain-containing protein [Thermosynechococcaceae cyanobacterium MS004]